jgi:hypothetical protein
VQKDSKTALGFSLKKLITSLIISFKANNSLDIEIPREYAETSLPCGVACMRSFGPPFAFLSFCLFAIAILAQAVQVARVARVADPTVESDLIMQSAK